MLEVKINLVPFGDYSNEKQIGYIKIWNDGTGNVNIGNYRYEIIEEGGEIINSGQYKGFYRSKGVFLLLNEILDDVYKGV